PRAELPQGAADLAGRVEIAGGDVGEWVHVLEAVRQYRVDCIYHAAAILSAACEASAASGFRTNVVGTMNVLEAARLLGVPDVMFVGSGATYGLANVPRQVDDTTHQQPENMYATTKLCAELLGQQYHRQYGINFRGARYAMIVGPGRQITHHYGDWSGVIERAAQGRPYTVHADPDCPCAYIYVKDAVRALLDLRRADTSRLRRRMYNVHGFTATLSEVAAAVRRHLPEAQIAFEWDKGETMRVANRSLSYEMDTTAASEDFGYTLRYPLEAMVVDFIGEVRAGKVA
ncbi:MAG: NAD-dependent epimerase/dehydratase family protein, partial [Candidatus Methylomirabilales bacterium]